MSDNEPLEAPGALLISPDPSGRTEALMQRICDLSPVAYRRYKEAFKALYEILYADTFTYFRGSAKAFYSIWSSANAAMAKGEVRPTSDPNSLVLWGTQLRSVALTLCLSLCYHQEQTLQQVCEKYGSDSAVHKKAKEIFSELHDSNPGYRYMYALRNVMIHDAMDAIALEATAVLDESHNPVGLWDLKLDRKVLADTKKLSASKKAEFSSLTENPSLLELFAQIAGPMNDANARLQNLIHPDLTEICRSAVQFNELFGDRVGARALVHRQSPQLRAGMQVGFTIWPDELIGFASAYERGQRIQT